MDYNDVLILIQKKEWQNLLSVLKDNQIFDSLISDSIFRDLFHTYFIKEILNDVDNSKEDKILELAAIYNFHKSTSYKFSLPQDEHEKLIVKLVEITGDYLYAKEYPDNPICKVIISQHLKEEEEKSKFIQDNFELKENLEIVEFEKNEKALLSKSIFNSPQEIEFYNAAKTVFQEEIILPNAALSTVITNEVLHKLENQEKWLFLTTTVDFVIVNNQTFQPMYFFELDSSYHDTPQQIIKDNLKNKLISGFGYKLYRTRKLTTGDKTEYFTKWLKSIKQST